MGQLTAARIDTAAVLGAACRYDTAAELLDTALRSHLTRLSFDGTRAGRSYADSGDAVRAAVEGTCARLADWSHAARQIAALLRTSVQNYADADVHAARRLG
ncbi:type VII secretion target [Mycobacterium sp. BMJ-28]